MVSFDTGFTHRHREPTPGRGGVSHGQSDIACAAAASQERLPSGGRLDSDDTIIELRPSVTLLFR